ncbi:hypothetical protein GA829_12310 [Mesorhizobium sp. INR15]|nr:hypothetical protein GA829_12310 [Mesorhizobium sp. INR15]
MRQRLLNGALAVALVEVLCLLAAGAYIGIEQGEAGGCCANANRIISSPADQETEPLNGEGS